MSTKLYLYEHYIFVVLNTQIMLQNLDFQTVTYQQIRKSFTDVFVFLLPKLKPEKHVIYPVICILTLVHNSKTIMNHSCFNSIRVMTSRKSNILPMVEQNQPQPNSQFNTQAYNPEVTSFKIYIFASMHKEIKGENAQLEFHEENYLD